MAKIKSYFRAVPQTLSRTNAKQYNIPQLLKTKDEEENLQSSQEKKKKKKITTEGTTMRHMADFPVQTIEARRQRDNSFKIWWGENDCR